MGFPTDVNYKRAFVNRGINRLFNSSGSALEAQTAVDVVNITGKAGKLLAANLFADSKDVYLMITIDGVRIQDNGVAEQPSNLIKAYGCCGMGSPMRVIRYDTVNDKYVMELTQPIEFGNSLKVQLYTYTAGDKACGEACYIENT